MSNQKKAIISVIILSTGIFFMMNSCNLADLFKQPAVEIKDFVLVGLPTEVTNLKVTAIVTNMDTRNAAVTKIVYTADIEGVSSYQMEYILNSTLVAGTGKTMTLPLTIPTAGAMVLLKELSADGHLDFRITGYFKVDDPFLSSFDLPLNTEGRSNVKKGISDFFKQPTVTVNKFKVTGISPNPLSFPPPLKVTIDLTCDVTVTNNSDFDATIDIISGYVANVNGYDSDKANYANVFYIASHGTKNLVLPLKIRNIPTTSLPTWVSPIPFTVTGMFSAESTMGTTDMNLFNLPLYVTGTTTLDKGSFW